MGYRIILPAGVGRDEWLAARRKGIASSDAAAAIGVCRFQTPLHVWLDKRGEAPDQDQEHLSWGRRLQPFILDEYALRMKRKIAVPPALVAHADDDWLLASLDATSLDDSGELIVEAKNSRIGDGFGADGTDELPAYYMAQAQHQLMVTALSRLDLAVLIGGCQLKIYHVERDQPAIEKMYDAEEKLWKMIAAGERPDPDWRHPATNDLIKRLSKITVGSVDWGHDMASIVGDYQALGEKIKDLEGERESLKSRILMEMGDAGEAVLPSGVSVTRSLQKRKAYSVKATEFIVLNVKKPKKS